VPKTTSSEGSSFAQKGGRGGRGRRGQATITFDKEYWKDKTCFNCGEKGHPSSSCMKAAVTSITEVRFLILTKFYLKSIEFSVFSVLAS
jgi:hypothetical protein